MISRERKLTDWLPTTAKEVALRGWDYLDVIIFSGDTYVDHPSFGAAVIGRILESEGLRVAIVAQPNWKDDFRDFKKLGRPRMFFGVSAGCMDSMVNKYTAAKRFRSEDAYSPDGKHSMRPEYATQVYCEIIKQLYPDTPLLIGGIEASMRRFTHYDYWQDKLKNSILIDSKADLLIYGMGEQPIIELTRRLRESISYTEGVNVELCEFNKIASCINQTGYLVDKRQFPAKTDDIILNTHLQCLEDKAKQAGNIRTIEEESNRLCTSRIVQQYDSKYVVINQPFAPMTPCELDKSYDLPYTRLPHPKYKGKKIPAYEMIRFSVNIHRGCFGGCSFCTISAHQGKSVVSRSKESIIKEVKELVKHPEFKGYLSDLGGPSANMYQMGGFDKKQCSTCKRPSCIYPSICKNLNTDVEPLLELYKAVDSVDGIKKSFVGSGVRYDLLLQKTGDLKRDNNIKKYTEELIRNHVSGRLKIAPEHTNDAVLQLMRKPSFSQFHTFKKIFDTINEKYNLRQQIIPYFISSHPGCELDAMAELAIETKKINFHLEQVQDFTPTPMTLSTEMYYSGINPYSGTKVYSAKSQIQKEEQRLFFFWYQPQVRNKIEAILGKIKRKDLTKALFGK